MKQLLVSKCHTLYGRMITSLFLFHWVVVSTTSMITVVVAWQSRTATSTIIRTPICPSSSWQQIPCHLLLHTRTSHRVITYHTRPSRWKLQAATIDGAINGESRNNNNIEAIGILEPNQSLNISSSNSNTINNNVFDLVSNLAAICLYQSHFRRDAIGTTNLRVRASSATNWIDDASARMLQQAMDQISWNINNNDKNIDTNQQLSSMEYIRWFKSIPSPAVVDLSMEMHYIVNNTITDEFLQNIDETRHDFLSRVQCRLFLVPSGTALPCPLIEPPATLVFGKLLYGGITRYRLLGTSRSESSSSTQQQSQRRVGVRTDVKPTLDDKVPTWIMYGGSDRMYESVDMGPAALLEVILYPRGQGKTKQHFISSSPYNNNNCNDKTVMQLLGITWKPQFMFDYQPVESTATKTMPAPVTMLPSGQSRNDAFRDGMQSTVGGLQSQIDTIVRRVLDGRVIRPATEYDDGSSTFNVTDEPALQSTASLEAEELQSLGLTPVRGLLLYGPPGCGKTALAREISRALRARTPKIVSAPELLDRWVGGSEKLVRQLFADAEAELAACNNDATKSALHVIVIDEIDAVFRKRSSSEDSGEATRSSVVNQILSKLDGVKAISNILVIGMTNRRELLDEALLRPGRLEVQVEIPLPDKAGRREILNVHFNALRQRGRLSRQLCHAIDGVTESGPQFNGTKLLARQTLERVIDPIVPITPASVLNLATDSISSSIGTATNAITDNIMLASDVMALDAISFPPGAIITDCVRLLRRTITWSRNGKRSTNDGALNRTVTSDIDKSTSGQRRNKVLRVGYWIRKIAPTLRVAQFDLASDEVTGGFSGADIAGLVRCAGSLALARARREGYGIDGLLITLEDVKAAVKEVRPKV